jgi:HAD superfamily hydrolase (TIGR01509 family)
VIVPATNHRRPTAVIFDMDGVLIDSEPIGYEAMRLVMDRYGAPYDLAQNDEFVGRTSTETFRILRARHGMGPDEAELARQFREAKIRIVRERAVPMAGVPVVLQGVRAAGYRLALASSAETPVIEATVETLGLVALFELQVSGWEVGRGKPAPDVFLETARRLGLPPAQCLVVEDSRNGLLAAKAAGMPCVVVPCEATLAHDFSEADHRIAALPDLLPLLLPR